MFYTGNPPFGTPLVQWDIEIGLICPLTVNPLMTSYGQKYMPLSFSWQYTFDLDIFVSNTYKPISERIFFRIRNPHIRSHTCICKKGNDWLIER